MGEHAYHHVRMVLVHLCLPKPSPPLGRNLDLKYTKLLSELFKLHFGQWIGQQIGYPLVCRNILELHCSSLHHIPDIVGLDLNVIRLVMEHWVLRYIHKNQIVTEDTR